MSKKVAIALAGNPNSGKTTIFNAITGSRHHVGNYPGVIVEKKTGVGRHRGRHLDVTDLPGMYSLTPYSLDERVARDHIIENPPDVVVDIIDSTNLERSLFLAVQLRELGVPLVLAFNMSDRAITRDIRFDLERLSRSLGTPIVPTVGHKNEGIETLLDAALDVADGLRNGNPLRIDYGKAVESEVAALEKVLAKQNGHIAPGKRRWTALKLLENDHYLPDDVRSPEVLATVEAITKRLEADGDAPEVTITSTRYQYISDVCQEGVHSKGEALDKRTARIDAVLTHRFFGLPIFLGLMYLVFQLTFTLASPIAGAIEATCGWLGGTLLAIWPSGVDSPLMSLFVDGVIGGVGGVLVFLPNVVLLFLAISILEDSGYMARAAFLMDRLMSKAGLHGKSFIPMLLGFGCNVPAIMATRTLENRRDRMTTMLILPFMSCGARLTIFALVIPAFFAPRWQGPVLWMMYLVGIILGITAANVLRATIFRGESTAFLMELPPYHTPTPKAVILHMWERAWLYVRKAGTIILGISIVLWALSTFPKKAALDADQTAPVTELTEDARRAEELSHSVVGRLGHAMEPVLRPMGFDWKIGTALVGAFAAKEVFVAQMGIVYSVGEADESSEALRDRLRTNYSPLVGLCILLFTLIATPCMATVAIMKRETNSWRWPLFQFAGLTFIGYALTVLVYQVGRFLGIGI